MVYLKDSASSRTLCLFLFSQDSFCVFALFGSSDVPLTLQKIRDDAMLMHFIRL